jgi:uncharacterized lipoprotein YmbA
MKMRPPLPLMLAAALTLGACANPDYYLLPPPQSVTRVAAPTSSIAVAEISLPAYAEAVEIATLVGPGAVTLNKNALWADTPRRALTRHLVAALEARLRTRVGTEPWPAFEGPGLRIEVIADRFVGAPGGVVEFAGQFIVVGSDSGSIVASDRFAIAVATQGDGYAALMDAHARAIEQLADVITARITGRAAPGA